MIKEYLSYQRNNKGLSANSLTAYRKVLHGFVQWAKPKGLRWSTITKNDLIIYTGDLKEQGRSAATIRQTISVLRSLFRWAQMQGMRSDDPALYLQSPKLADSLPQPADMTQAEAYLKTPANTDAARSAHAIVAVLSDTGCRIQEVLNIKLQDIDHEKKTIMITGKGGKQRIVYYTERTTFYCAATAGKRDGYLIDVDNQETARTLLYNELGKGFHPHAFRHAFATSLLNNGATLSAVGKLLGHTSTKTTERYARLSDRTTEKQYRAYRYEQ